VGVSKSTINGDDCCAGKSAGQSREHWPGRGPDQRRIERAFFESEQHRAAALDGIGKSILPLKFAYAGSAAHAHDAFVQSTGGRAGSDPADERGPADPAPPPLSPDQLAAGVSREIVEIGPGNGMRTVALLQRLSGTGFPCHRMLAVDFSATLLTLARRRIADLPDAPLVDTEVWDIELGPSDCVRRWRTRSPLLACFFGNTLGNVECDRTTLANIHATLDSDDVLLLGVMLHRPDRPVGEVLAPYRTEAFRASVLEPLRAAGIPHDDIDFELCWSGTGIYGVATFRRAVRLDAVEVPQGHRLRCFQSRRFTLDQAVALIETAGFSVECSSVDRADDHMIIKARRGEGGIDDER
jgi:L-histidine N-alpha-methyltransferase